MWWRRRDDGQRYNSLACDGASAVAAARSTDEPMLPPVIHGGGAELRYALSAPTEV